MSNTNRLFIQIAESVRELSQTVSLFEESLRSSRDHTIRHHDILILGKELREAGDMLAAIDLEVHQHCTDDTCEVLQYEKPYYWRVLEADIEGPYCQHCYDELKKCALLLEREESEWYCEQCGQTFHA